MPQNLLKQAKQALPWMILCGVSVVFNRSGDELGLMSCKRGSENRQALVSFQGSEPSWWLFERHDRLQRC